MSDTEIDWNEDMKAYEPCSTCLNIALDAAYSNGWTTEDDEYILIEDDDDQYDYNEDFSFLTMQGDYDDD